MRLIDADTLLEMFEDRLAKVTERYGYDSAVTGAVSGAMKLIKYFPSAEPERKTARWIGGELGHCSGCGHDGCASDIWDRCQEYYCPNCGAKMEV